MWLEQWLSIWVQKPYMERVNACSVVFEKKKKVKKMILIEVDAQ